MKSRKIVHLPPRCFGSGVAHEDASYLFFRDGVGRSSDLCLKAPGLPSPSLFYVFVLIKSCVLLCISRLLLRWWWWWSLSAAEEKLLVVSFPLPPLH